MATTTKGTATAKFQGRLDYLCNLSAELHMYLDEIENCDAYTAGIRDWYYRGKTSPKKRNCPLTGKLYRAGQSFAASFGFERVEAKLAEIKSRKAKFRKAYLAVAATIERETGHRVKGRS